MTKLSGALRKNNFFGNYGFMLKRVGGSEDTGKAHKERGFFHREFACW